MKSKTAVRLLDEEQALDLSSLTDICFLLLIYFLVTSTITPRERDLSTTAPSRNASVMPAKMKPLIIRISGDGVIHTGDGVNMLEMDTDSHERQLPLLERQLKLYAEATRASGELPMVMIDVSDENTHQRMVDVLNALASVGIRDVAFAAGH